MIDNGAIDSDPEDWEEVTYDEEEKSAANE